MSTNKSVEDRAHTADNLGFATIVVSDATFTFDEVDFAQTRHCAEDVHLMVLANLHDEYAEVLSCDEVRRRYELTEDAR